MKTEGFTKNIVKTLITLIFLQIFPVLTLLAVETGASVSLGGGWKSDIDPVFSFRSAADIFKRSDKVSSGTMTFSAEGGLSSEKESGFFVDMMINGLISLNSVRNSVLYSGIDGGYIYSVDKNNLLAVTAGVHNSAFDFDSLKSLYVDPHLSLSYLFDPLKNYSLFLRTGFSYYFPTDIIVEYLKGPSVFAEGGGRINFNKYGTIDLFGGASFTFFSDQKIRYNRYNDVYYGELTIEGSYYSLYSGLSYIWNRSFFSFPVSLKYIFSRSFGDDTHKTVYWSDAGIPSSIFTKTRIDSTVEFSFGAVFDIFEKFSISADYYLHSTISNVGMEKEDYADYNRLAHTVSVEVSYEY